MMNTFLFFILPAALVLFGVPIFLTLLVTAAAIILHTGAPMGGLQIYMFGSLDNFPLLAVPFFVLAGEIMAQGGVAQRIIAWIMSLIGNVRGSLPVTTVAASEVFGAMTHTAVGTVVAVGRMMHPSLRQNGYSERFSVGLIASSGAIAVVIPPSISMIIYALVAQQSAISLFTAGVLPSIFIGLVGAAYVIGYATLKNVARSTDERVATVWKTTKDASWSLGTIAVIFGGIYGGVFTPTEAAGVAVVYALFVTMVVHREVGLSQLWQILVSTVVLVSQIMIIVMAAGVYANQLTTSGIPQQIVETIIGLHMPAWLLLLSINVLLLLMGSFLEPPAAIMILTPLLLPIVRAVGMDPIHFGIVIAVNLSIGMYTPPFGLNLLATQAVLKTPLSTVYRGALPFVLINFGVLLVITYVPWFSMALLSK
jgi:C4-dicarboxylate transporter DctM subunit